MPVWKLATAAVVAALLAGCVRDDPQAALEGAAKALQQNIENKDAAALLAQIIRNFVPIKPWTANGYDAPRH